MSASPQVRTLTRSATIRRRVALATQTKVRSERRAIILDWIHEIRWTGDEAEITLRVPTVNMTNLRLTVTSH